MDKMQTQSPFFAAEVVSYHCSAAIMSALLPVGLAAQAQVTGIVL
jgi:hypothetical protein